jgi:hypothetical protein
MGFVFLLHLKTILINPCIFLFWIRFLSRLIFWTWENHWIPQPEFVLMLGLAKWNQFLKQNEHHPWTNIPRSIRLSYFISFRTTLILIASPEMPANRANACRMRSECKWISITHTSHVEFWQRIIDQSINLRKWVWERNIRWMPWQMKHLMKWTVQKWDILLTKVLFDLQFTKYKSVISLFESISLQWFQVLNQICWSNVSVETPKTKWHP